MLGWHVGTDPWFFQYRGQFLCSLRTYDSRATRMAYDFRSSNDLTTTSWIRAQGPYVHTFYVYESSLLPRCAVCKPYMQLIVGYPFFSAEEMEPCYRCWSKYVAGGCHLPARVPWFSSLAGCVTSKELMSWISGPPGSLPFPSSQWISRALANFF
jgi:hypothetical protein